MNSNSSGHSHYEELCALASVGQVSPSEFQELSNHLAECGQCRESYSDFLKLTHQQLPVGAGEQLEPKRNGVLGYFLGKYYRARFAARAAERGLEITDAWEASSWFWSRLAVFSVPKLSCQPTSIIVILILLGLTGILSYRLSEAEHHGAASSAQISKLADQNGFLEQQVKTLSQSKQAAETSLQETRMSANALNAHARELEEQVKRDQLALEESGRKFQGLYAQLNSYTAHSTETETKLRAAQQRLSALTLEIADLKSSRNENGASVEALQSEIADLSRHAKEQEDVIEKQRKLLSVDSDVRGLMAARNLHITDVFDVDGQGKKKRAFGRVFYTEGKSLIFYAFDLDAPKMANAKHTFQAWGQLVDASTTAVSLGIFYVDDPAQKRWILKFDNPELLAQISAVFVTAEPHPGTARPTGQKLMYAYLGHAPNHS